MTFTNCRSFNCFFFFKLSHIVFSGYFFCLYFFYYGCCHVEGRSPLTSYRSFLRFYPHPAVSSHCSNRFLTRFKYRRRNLGRVLSGPFYIFSRRTGVLNIESDRCIKNLLSKWSTKNCCSHRVYHEILIRHLKSYQNLICDISFKNELFFVSNIASVGIYEKEQRS